MNKIFTNNRVIVLDEKWDLTPDSDSGVVLTFREPRKRDKTEKINGKKVKTGEVEDYIFEDKWYTTRVAQALRIYVEKSLSDLATFKEIIEKEDKIFDLISKLDKTFKQF